MRRGPGLPVCFPAPTGRPAQRSQRREKAAARQTRRWRRSERKPNPASLSGHRARCGCAKTPLVPRLVAAGSAPRPAPSPSVTFFLRARQRAGGRASRGRRGGSSRRGLRTPGPRSRPQPRQRLHGPSATDPSAVLSLRPRPGLFPPANRAARRRSPPHRAARAPSFRPRPRPPACPFQPRGRFPGTSRPPAARWRPWVPAVGRAGSATPAAARGSPHRTRRRHVRAPDPGGALARTPPTHTPFPGLLGVASSPSLRATKGLRRPALRCSGSLPARPSAPALRGSEARRVGAAADGREGLRERQGAPPPRRGGGGAPGGSLARTARGAVPPCRRSSSCEERGRTTKRSGGARRGQRGLSCPARLTGSVTRGKTPKVSAKSRAPLGRAVSLGRPC